MTPGELLGLLFMFALFMVPSGLFVGALIGRAFGWSFNTRCIVSACIAALCAYGVVFHMNGAGSVDDDCPPSRFASC